MDNGEQTTKSVKALSKSDLALKEVLAPVAIPNAWTAGDDDVEMANNDTLLLYVTAVLDAGSVVTELRLRLSFDPDGTGTFYDETGVDLQVPAGGVMDADLVDVEYVLVVAGGGTYNKMFTLPVDAAIVRVSVIGDAVGADDLLSVNAARMLRDG